VGLYGSEVVLPWGRCFWTGGPAYDTKSQCNNNTNDQLANLLDHITNTLTANQTPSPNANSKETKAHIPNIFSSTELVRLNNFLFQCYLYFYANPA